MPPIAETVLRNYSGTLAAGAIVTFEAYGDYVFLLSNSGTANTLKVSFDNGAEQVIPVGLVLHRNQVYTRIILRNTDTGSTTFTILAGQGQLDYKALVIGNTITVGPSQSTSGTAAADVATGAAAKIYTMVAGIKSIFVQADYLNTDQIYLGFDNTVTATKKFIALAPGQVWEGLNINCDIWAFSAAAQKASVSSW